MKQTRPVLHARDHMAGGADPIPLTSGIGGDWSGRILSLSGLVGYWRLGEGASPYADTSGITPPNDMVRVAGTVAMTQDVTPGLLPAGQDDGAVAFNNTNPALAGDYLHVADTLFAFNAVNPFTAVALIKPGAGGSVSHGGVVGTMTNVVGSPNWTGGWALRVNWPEMTVGLARGTGPGVFSEALSTAISGDTAYMVAGTYDGATLRVYINGTLAGSKADASYAPSLGDLRIGLHVVTGATNAPFDGVIDEVAVWNRALTAAELANLYDSATTPDAAGAGWVQTADGAGGVTWQPPGIEVEHGDGTPDEHPVTTPGGAYTGFPANPSGWHYAAHTETAVLYDSSPARFDVPSMKWVRTPFNTVRIQRRWELTVGGQFKDAWLPDDRGLTDHARNGLLHITPEMASATVKHIIDGFFSIEYPVLDYQGLPDFTGGGIIAPDQYVRAGRVLNASTGVVLRRLPGSNQRRFMQWEWLNDADAMAVSVLYTVDNPFPLYPVWPARPLTLPQPYPKLSPTQSLDYYLTAAGNPGFGDGTFALEQNLVAGDNLCLQGWQDSPWLLRFSTDHFPPWNPWPYAEAWRRRPFLSVTYTYDPDSVNHTTGKLL